MRRYEVRFTVEVKDGFTADDVASSFGVLFGRSVLVTPAPDDEQPSPQPEPAASGDVCDGSGWIQMESQPLGAVKCPGARCAECNPPEPARCECGKVGCPVTRPASPGGGTPRDYTMDELIIARGGWPSGAK